MKYFLVLFLIIPLFGQAQNNSDDLFIQPWELCQEWLKENIEVLCQEFPNQESLEAVLYQWELVCDPNLASIRHRLLGDLIYKGGLDPAVPLKEFSSQHLNFLFAQNSYDPLQVLHWQYCHDQAQKLLELDRWSLRDRFILELIAADDHHEAIDLFYQKEYQELEEVKQNRPKLEEEVYEVINFSIGYNRLQFNEVLETELRAANGIWMALDLKNSKNLFALSVSFNYSEQKSYLRMVQEGNVRTSDLEMLFMGDLNYGRTILAGRRHTLQLLIGIGMADFSTDLRTENADGETILIGISSYHFNLGLNYSWRIYGGHEIGLRPVISFSNFNRDENLRSNLSGSILQSSLYYRF